VHVEEQFGGVWREKTGNNREPEIIKTARTFVAFIHLILLGRLPRKRGDLLGGNKKYTKLRSERLKERNHFQDLTLGSK
jgi:hypothetical protein